MSPESLDFVPSDVSQADDRFRAIACGITRMAIFVDIYAPGLLSSPFILGLPATDDLGQYYDACLHLQVPGPNFCRRSQHSPLLGNG